ncbi:MAG: DUF4440 domain-containing protein [Bacteroidota bacterium]
MKTNSLLLVLLSFSSFGFSQYEYEPSPEHPFGLPNPEAPQELLDFAPLIGECDCKSITRKADQSWADPEDMIWRFKYIMNGMAVQDETLKADGKHSGSIRQFIADSTRWYVHYYSSGSPSTQLPVWEGNKNQDDTIILYRAQKAPNGMEGSYRLTFSDISSKGFKWLGEWVSKDQSVVFPTWKIDCLRRNEHNVEDDKTKILGIVQKFSKDFMNADYDGMLDIYAEDSKIFPGTSDIIEGLDAIKQRWLLSKDSKILHHEINPIEINFLGNYAYDYGYYNGKTQKPDNSIAEWKGKYVVVWKKYGDTWKMYLDIWNQILD